MVRVTIGENLPGTVTQEERRRLGVKEWTLSEEAVAKIEKIEAQIFYFRRSH